MATKRSAVSGQRSAGRSAGIPAGSEDPIAEDQYFLPPRDMPETMNWGIGLAIVGLLFLAAALLGSNDHAQAEADSLRAEVAQCRAALGEDSPSPRPSPSRGEGENHAPL